MRSLLLCLCMIALPLMAQKAEYKLSNSFGLAGIHGEDAVNQGAFVSVALDRVYRANRKLQYFAGLSLQYANYESGVENLPCDFPLGDKIITFSFSETYEFNPLEANLRLGAIRKFGKLSVRGTLLPTLRVRDKLTSSYAINFDQLGRPDQFIAEKVRPGEAFTWTDGYQRELRYNTPFQLQAALEVDFEITKRLAVGLGFQRGITKYTLDNVFLEQEVIVPPGETCGFAGCTILDERVETSTDARTGRGYLVLRFAL